MGVLDIFSNEPHISPPINLAYYYYQTWLDLEVQRAGPPVAHYIFQPVALESFGPMNTQVSGRPGSKNLQCFRR